MGVFAYLCIGLLAGVVSQRFTKTEVPEQIGLMSTTFLGAAGAVVAGVAWDVLLEQNSITVVGWSSVVVATVGACTTFGALHIIRK